MKTIFTLLLAGLTLGLSGQTIDQELYLVMGQDSIAGSLMCPSVAEQQVPVVLIIAGSGPTDRNGNNAMMENNGLKMLAEGLASAGIASLRYDKRGVGESRNALKSEADLRFEDAIADASGWVDVLDVDDRFSQIIVAGHSEGSTIGMVVAKRPEVDKYISLAGPADRASAMIETQLGKRAPRLLDLAKPFLGQLNAGTTIDSVPPLLMNLFRPNVQPYLISWFAYDPKAELPKLHKPVLLLQGTTDIQVDVDQAEQLKAAHPPAELVIVEGMNHVLKPAEAALFSNAQTYNQPELALHQDLLPSIIAFIRQ